LDAVRRPRWRGEANYSGTPDAYFNAWLTATPRAVCTKSIIAMIKIKSKGEKFDLTTTAASVVSRSFGENLFDGTPLSDPNEGKDPKAIESEPRGSYKKAVKYNPKICKN
jgi:hypothetical protein